MFQDQIIRWSVKYLTVIFMRGLFEKKKASVGGREFARSSLHIWFALKQGYARIRRIDGKDLSCSCSNYM